MKKKLIRMNEKMKTKMKGFTLLEMLGVILIIAFIVLVAVPTISRVMESSKEKLYEAQASSIESAAEMWAAENADFLPKKDKETTTVFLYTLRMSGALEGDIVNPLTDEVFPDDTLIEIHRDNNFFEYKVIKDSGSIGTFYGEETPMIVLMGALNDTVQFNYFTHNWKSEEAIKLIDKDGNLIEGANVDTIITVNSEVISEIDTNILREYLVEYKINYNGFEKSIVRKVNLVDTLPPSIAFSKSGITVEQCSTYDWQTDGVTASDNSGSFNIVITGIVECVPGNYSLTYTVTDPHGNVSARTRDVTIVEELAGGSEPYDGPWIFEVTTTVDNYTFIIGFADADLVIDWGDGSNNTYAYVGQDYISHQYATAGIYDVTVTGTTTHITFCNFASISCTATGEYRLTKIKTPIPSSFGLTSSAYMFADTKMLSFDTIGFFDDASSGILDMEGMFYRSELFNEDIRNWDVSNVTNMSHMFDGADLFNQDIGNWDVSNVTNMSSTFDYAESFNQDIGDWDVSNVTTMNHMFADARDFNGDISTWDVSSVTDMNSMFYDAGTFNQDISGWNVANVTDMTWMLSATDFFNQNIGNWDVSNVTIMQSMFANAVAFNGDISTWDVSSVTAMDGMFYNAEAFNQDIGEWNISNVTNLSRLFYNADLFNQDIGNWDTSKVTDMDTMFRSAFQFNQDLSGWCTTSLITSPPYQFDLYVTSWTLPKPVWGTCP